jgi:hypothetical protein
MWTEYWYPTRSAPAVVELATSVIRRNVHTHLGKQLHAAEERTQETQESVGQRRRESSAGATAAACGPRALEPGRVTLKLGEQFVLFADFGMLGEQDLGESHAVDQLNLVLLRQFGCRPREARGRNRIFRERAPNFDTPQGLAGGLLRLAVVLKGVCNRLVQRVV